ncbi:MAG: chemotaxis protein CheW [Celeribacter marinus]
MIEDTKHSASASIELLSFRVGGQDYSVDIMSVREIRGSAKATSLPHAPAFVKGVINLRGTVLPIIDLAARLGLENEGDNDRNVIIVVDLGGRTAGLMVDAVSDILAIPNEDLQAPPEVSIDDSRTFVSALTVVDNRMIRVLDLDAVMPPPDEEAA